MIASSHAPANERTGRSLFLTLLFLIHFHSLHVEGSGGEGGSFRDGGVVSSGAVTGLQDRAPNDIRLFDQQLHVTLGLNKARVEARYVLRNETNRKVTVSFGLPLEEIGDDHTRGFSPAPPHTRLAYVRNHRIAVDGKPLKTRWQAEAANAETPRPAHELAGWLRAELSFAKSEEKVVQISFDSFYPRYTRSEGRDDTTYGAPLFRHRLSTAASWAGTVGQGRIILEPEGVSPDEIKVLKPADRFRREGNRQIWEFADLEPTAESDLEIEAQPERHVYTPEDSSIDQAHELRGNRWSLIHSAYIVRASSTLPPQGNLRYDAENLKEWTGDVWAEGAPGPGIGEWIECELDTPALLTAISFTPGYRNYKGLYHANARPKTIRLELNDEHAQILRVDDLPIKNRHTIHGYSKPVKKIRMTFEEVWAGTQFEDMCLHSLLLHVPLDKKPEF